MRHEYLDEPDVYRDGSAFELATLSAPITVAETYDGIIEPSGRSLLR